MHVDWEERVDFRRLHAYRLGRARQAIADAGLGAVLVFDVNNIRYLTSTTIGEWARDKVARFAILTRTGDPILWDFGSAAKAHRLHAPWLKPENSRAGMTGLRGSVAPEAGLSDDVARTVKDIMREQGVAGEPLGVDIAEMPMVFALQACAIKVVDGQQAMLDARQIKSKDEITLLSMSAALVDGVYQTIYEVLKPGIRENEVVAIANKQLYDMGSDDVEAINAVSGERCSPHPHVFSDRLIRPGDTAYFDIIHSFNGYRTCYYRTLNVGSADRKQREAYRRAREFMDNAISEIRPGATSADVVRHFPAATEFGFADEEEAFGLQYCHGLGLSNWERPLMSRYHSFEHPVELKEGMVFAIETYWPAADGSSAARIEEEVVVTAGGCELLTRFPADQLYVAGTRLFTGASLAAPEESA